MRLQSVLSLSAVLFALVQSHSVPSRIEDISGQIKRSALAVDDLERIADVLDSSTFRFASDPDELSKKGQNTRKPARSHRTRAKSVHLKTSTHKRTAHHTGQSNTGSTKPTGAPHHTGQNQPVKDGKKTSKPRKHHSKSATSSPEPTKSSSRISHSTSKPTEPSRSHAAANASPAKAARSSTSTAQPYYQSTHTVSHATIIIAVVIPVVAILLLVGVVAYTYKKRRDYPGAWVPFSPSHPSRFSMGSGGFFFKPNSMRSSTISRTYDHAAPRALMGADMNKVWPVNVNAPMSPEPRTGESHWSQRQMATWFPESPDPYRPMRSATSQRQSQTWFPASPVPNAPQTPERVKPKIPLRNAWFRSHGPLKRKEVPEAGPSSQTQPEMIQTINYTDTTNPLTNEKSNGTVVVTSPIPEPHPATIPTPRSPPPPPKSSKPRASPKPKSPTPPPKSIKGETLQLPRPPVVTRKKVPSPPAAPPSPPVSSQALTESVPVSVPVPVTAPAPPPAPAELPKSESPVEKILVERPTTTPRYELGSPALSDELRMSAMDLDQPYLPPSGLYQQLVNATDINVARLSQVNARESTDRLSINSEPSNQTTMTTILPPPPNAAPRAGRTHAASIPSRNSRRPTSSVYSVYIPARRPSRIAQSGLSIRTTQTNADAYRAEIEGPFPMPRHVE